MLHTQTELLVNFGPDLFNSRTTTSSAPLSAQIYIHATGRSQPNLEESSDILGGFLLEHSSDAAQDRRLGRRGASVAATAAHNTSHAAARPLPLCDQRGQGHGLERHTRHCRALGLSDREQQTQTHMYNIYIYIYVIIQADPSFSCTTVMIYIHVSYSPHRPLLFFIYHCS